MSGEEPLRRAIEAEIERLREKGRRNAALIHYAQADRLEEILNEPRNEPEEKT